MLPPTSLNEDNGCEKSQFLLVKVRVLLAQLFADEVPVSVYPPMLPPVSGRIQLIFLDFLDVDGARVLVLYFLQDVAFSLPKPPNYLTRHLPINPTP